MPQILDGPLGTQLEARGVDTRLPLWSARALLEAPDQVAAIHRDYVRAGATLHTANTFRTKRRTLGASWEKLAREAVAIARRTVPEEHQVLGSIAPLEDCYRPDLSPEDPTLEHRELAEVLADAGVDVLLCETFPHVGEALAAIQQCVATGVTTWVAFTAGPNANLLTPEQMAEAAHRAVDAGAAAVLVNCVPATATLPFVKALAPLGVPVGAYANAGQVDDAIGWRPPTEAAVEAYLDLTRAWHEAGATILGSCCGTGPDHIAALARWAAGLASK